MARVNKTVKPANVASATNDKELEAVVNTLEAQEEANSQAPVQAPPAPSSVSQAIDDLKAIVNAIPEDEKLAAAKQIGEAFDKRAKFEASKNASNLSIQQNLTKSRKVLAMPSAAAIMIATSADLDFVNRSVSSGSAYNVYGIDKVADLVRGLEKGAIGNAINRAVCVSLFRFRTAGEAFTGEMARAAASDKIRVQGKIKDLLMRHTVSAATAPTQASSTMSALQTLGIVRNKGTLRAPVYELTDTPATKRLEEILMAA